MTKMQTRDIPSGKVSASKKLSSKEKKAKRKQELAASKAHDDSVRIANARSDVLDDVSSFRTFNRNGLNLSLDYFVSEAMPEELRSWCFELLKSNMETLYAEDWDEKEKISELKDDEARFIVAKDAETGEPAAFVHLRFVFEENVEVLYVYELQIAEMAQRKGVGKFMMQICELVGRKNNMKGVMLTSFKNNPSANAFYLEKLKYVIDPISPSYVNPLAKDEYSYEIISKIWCKDAQKALKKRAEEARDCWLEEGLEDMVMKAGNVKLSGPA